MIKFKTVWVVGGDGQTANMFFNRGYKLQKDNADLVCFTGGEDVDPSYYGEKKLTRTFSNKNRDELEKEIFDKHIKTAKVGICRGGQFLNVMSGGAMSQHVNNHGIGGEHAMTDLLKQRTIQVTSTHHQMMRPSKDGETIAIANRSTEFVSADPRLTYPAHDTEVVYYEKTRSLCFQPHPEYRGKKHEMQDYFFELIENLL